MSSEPSIIEVEVKNYVIEVTLAVLNTVTVDAASLVHPQNVNTKIQWDADGGVTILTDTRLTVKNTATGDEVTY